MYSSNLGFLLNYNQFDQKQGSIQHDCRTSCSWEDSWGGDKEEAEMLTPNVDG